MPRRVGPSAAGIAALQPYNNTILGAIQNGASNAEIWQAVKDAGGVFAPGQGPTIFDMNAVAGRNRAVNAAQEAVAAGDPSQLVTSDMWAPAPWSDASTGFWGEPEYQLRGQFDVTLPSGDNVTVWGQTDWQGSLDVPLQNLLDRATQSATEAFGGYSPTDLGVRSELAGAVVNNVTALQIMRV